MSSFQLVAFFSSHSVQAGLLLCQATPLRLWPRTSRHVEYGLRLYHHESKAGMSADHLRSDQHKESKNCAHSNSRKNRGQSRPGKSTFLNIPNLLSPMDLPTLMKTGSTFLIPETVLNRTGHWQTQ